MLPGFRFLFIATILTVSVLVFGLGAAALLRATHDSFATLPQRRPPEQVFVKQRLDTPVIALLRVEPEQNVSSAVSAVSPETARVEPTIVDVQAKAPAGSVVAALAIPEPPPAPALDPGTLQSEILRSLEQQPVAAGAPVEISTATDASPSIVTQRDGTSGDNTTATAAPPAKIAALSSGGDEAAKLAVEAQKKTEAAKLRSRKLEAARRARIAKQTAQRRRNAAIRSRAAQQKPAAQPFNAPFGTN